MAASQTTNKAGVKLAADIGPLILFFGVYMFGDRIREALGLDEWWEPIYLATAVFIPASLLGLVVGLLTFKKLSPMPLFTAAVVFIMGGLTLILHNETFIYMKPTVTNVTFGVVLLAASAFGKLPFRAIFKDAFSIDREGWAKLQVRWACFFLFLAGLNELIWRFTSEPVWVAYKVWGVLPLTLAFGITMAMTVGRAHALDGSQSQSEA